MQFRLMLILILALCGTACLRSPSPCHVPPVDRHQACLEIRRQLIFLGSNDPTLSSFQYTAGNWKSPTRQALLLRKYREYHCEEVLRSCPMPRW
jgi:hypothetical protein